MSEKNASRDLPTIKTPQELVHVQHSITIRQYKYWLLMIKAYHDAWNAGPGAVDPSIPMREIEARMGYLPSRAELKDDLEALRKEAVIYNLLGKDGKPALHGAGFISEWEISKNTLSFRLPDFLCGSIQALGLKGSIFQQLRWHIFNQFTGKYEAILYLLAKDYVGVGRTPWLSVAEFRQYCGLSQSEYAEFKDLNKFTISGPAKKISEHEASDITIDVEFKRAGRKIDQIQFLVEKKAQASLDFGDIEDPVFAAARAIIPPAQQRQYLTEHSPAEIVMAIGRANDYIDEQQAKGTAVENIGAIYRTAIQGGWGAEQLAAQKKKAAAAQEQHQQAEKMAKEKAAAKAETEALAKRRAASTAKAVEQFDRLDKAEQDRLLEQFADSLNAFQRGVFRRDGLKSALITKSFELWLSKSLVPEQR